MLFQKGINWNDYPAFFKRGSYARRFEVKRPLTDLELQQIPEKHRPTTDVVRAHVACVCAPPLESVGFLTPFLFGGSLPSRGDLV